MSARRPRNPVSVSSVGEINPEPVVAFLRRVLKARRLEGRAPHTASAQASPGPDSPPARELEDGEPS